MKRYIFLLSLLVSSTSSVLASSMMDADKDWHVSASMGYTRYKGMLDNDGKTTVQRISLGRDLFDFGRFRTGLEVGVQNGNHMRLHANATDYSNLGGTAIQTTVNSFADALVYVESGLPFLKDMTAYLKGGVAYRRVHFDRDTMNSLGHVDPEVQVGFGKDISKDFRISLGYQGIFSGTIGLKTTSSGTGKIRNIPAQHGALLSLTASI